MNWNDLPLEELKSYLPPLTAEADFDLFWAMLIDESSNQALNTEVQPFDYPMDQVRVSRMRFSGFRNSVINGTLVEPVERKAGSPVAVQFHGYNWNSAQVHYGFGHVMAGRSCLLLDVRGQDLESPDHNRYPHGAAAGWLTQGILAPHEHYYTYVMMDSYRAIEALIAHFKEPDLKIISEGISQGGGLALTTGSLHPNVRAVSSDVPFLSHYRRSVEKAMQGPYSEISHFFKIQDPLHKLEDKVYRTLSYIDAMNHAARIAVPVLMSVGLEDDICPPSSVFAAFNHLESADKRINVYPDFAHGGFSLQEEEKIRFYDDVFHAQ